MDGVSVAASVLAIATAGVQISIKLVSFSNQVSTAPNRIRSIGSDVSTTSNVLQQLSELMVKREGQEAISVFSGDGLQNTQASAGACQAIFVELEDALKRCSKQLSERPGNKLPAAHITLSKLEALKWPFLQPEVNNLHTELKGARDNLMLILQVTTLAYSRKLAELKQPPILSASDSSLIMGAIVALHQAKSNAVSSPLDDAVCEEAEEDPPEEDQPSNGRSEAVPFSKDIMDDKPENSPNSMLSSNNIREQVLLKVSSRVPSLARESDSISNPSVPETPSGSPPTSTRDRQLPRQGYGRLSTILNSWRRKSAIVNEKQYPDRPASDTARKQDFRSETQNTTGATVAKIKKANMQNPNRVATPHSQSTATTPRRYKKSETNSSRWTLATVNPLMEIWEIEPTFDERMPRQVYYTVKQLPLEQNDIKRSFRRSRRWKRVDNVKQYAKLFPSEREVIGRCILQRGSRSEERRIIGIVVHKVSVPRHAFAYMPQRQLLVFARRYIVEVPDTGLEAKFQPSLPNHFPRDRAINPIERHERHQNRRARSRGQSPWHDSRTRSPVDPGFEWRLQRLSDLERKEEEGMAERSRGPRMVEEYPKTLEDRFRARAEAAVEDKPAVYPFIDIDELLGDKKTDTGDDSHEPNEEIIERAPRDLESPEHETPEQIVDALLAKYTTVRL